MTTLQAQMQRTDVENSIQLFNMFKSELTTEVKSTTFMKKLVYATLSNITYLRMIFPEEAYTEKRVNDITVKVIRKHSNDPEVKRFFKWMQGCVDALERKYLRKLMLGMYTDPDNPDCVTELYTFRFTYHSNGGISMSHQEGQQTVEPKPMYTLEEVKKETMKMMRNLLVLTQTLDHLPPKAYLTIKLLYYDEVTPMTYEPPNFAPGDTEGFDFDGPTEMLHVGKVSTNFHQMSLRLRSTGNVDELLEEGGQQTEIELECGGLDHSEDHLALDGDNDKDQLVPYQNSDPSEMMRGEAEQPMDAEPEDLQPINIVICPCGLSDVDGLMLICSECQLQQHAVCFRILSQSDVPQKHICSNCCDETNPEKYGTDPSLSKYTTIEQQNTCLYRRVLLMCENKATVSTETLATRFPASPGTLNVIKSWLMKDRIILKGKGEDKQVDHNRLTTYGFPEYLFHDKDNDKMDEDELNRKTNKLFVSQRKGRKRSIESNKENDPAGSTMSLRGRKKVSRSQKD